MGLDMYLKARRVYSLDDAQGVLTAAKTSVDELRELYSPDEGRYHGYLYIGGWNHSRPEEIQKYNDVLIATQLPTTDASPSFGVSLNDQDEVEVSSTAIYWRKTNAIHAWFVRECQAGVDNCESYPVSPEQLAMLCLTCEEALAAYEAGDLDTVRALLNPQSGFFFGSTEIDEWWEKDIKRTIREIKELVEHISTTNDVELAYQSSW